ncbi:Pyridine nucleotide-disulfide oxidoreductase family protein [Aspergillus niger]|uniref:Pyridine nucleotide-disulfide oxidoreductase family protein n=1 Tax=Aspergillus niger TaxID=5061 RepID=A0A505ICP8_ASPNG|nr:Pyridine nucleotide-disulfide oxidoreductase family protein [Aspergillus niger]
MATAMHDDEYRSMPPTGGEGCRPPGDHLETGRAVDPHSSVEDYSRAAVVAAKFPDSSGAEAEAVPVRPAGKRNAVVRRRPKGIPFAVAAVVVHDILPEAEEVAVLYCHMHYVVGGIGVDDGIQAEEGWIVELADAENRTWIAPAIWTEMHCEVGMETVFGIGNHAGVICAVVNEIVTVNENSSRWRCRCIVGA